VPSPNLGANPAKETAQLNAVSVLEPTLGQAAGTTALLCLTVDQLTLNDGSLGPGKQCLAIGQGQAQAFVRNPIGQLQRAG
jgi:hypothetical protein